MKKTKPTLARVVSLFFAVLIIGLGAWAVFRTPDTVLEAERRDAAHRPVMTLSSIMDGSFFEDAEDYLLDQFPLRDGFRRLKALWQYRIFGQKDNHGIILRDGHAAQLLPALSTGAEETFVNRLTELQDRFLTQDGLNFYLTVIPDKMAYLAGTDYPALDYDALRERMSESGAGRYIDLFDCLDIGSYYTTDSHWTQPGAIPAANELLSAMGAMTLTDYTLSEPMGPFYGVYYGESALPLPADSIVTVHTGAIDSALVQRAHRTKPMMEDAGMYPAEGFASADPYDVFLGGACGVITLENPAPSAEVSGRTLCLFSDSFGRSLAPLMLAGYEKVVVYDIRYITASLALELVPVEEGADVLFAYSISAIDVSANLMVR